MQKTKQDKKEVILRNKILQLLEEVLFEDYGDEPEVFNENDMRSQAWKAYNVLKDALK